MIDTTDVKAPAQPSNPPSRAAFGEAERRLPAANFAPWREEAQNLRAPPAERELPPRLGAQPRGRVLVVDDEPNARSALAELLRDEGHTVETAADGFKALPHLESLRPEVVLTDLKMPGL